MDINNSDWKLFRERIADWQEAYMNRLALEYIDILKSDRSPSDRFWELERRIKQDRRRPGVTIEMRKQNLPFSIASLINDGAIEFEDLDGFSEELKETVRRFIAS